jgi:predicted site-specific integrase-resolvase
MKLATWAKEHGIAYITAWRWFKYGKLPVPAIKTATGMILVMPSAVPTTLPTFVYARVSSPNKKGDLDRQAQRAVDFCSAKGWTVEVVVKEIASGMNDKRRRLDKLLDRGPARLVIEHKDRLTRFGFGYFDKLLPKLGWELVVMNRDSEAKDDMMKDLIAVITSFCCRLYGLRRGQKKAKELKDALPCEEPVK